jgi:hypothetical protein
MTMLIKGMVECAVCSTENTVTTIQSIYAGSWTGLDGRPPTLPRNLVALTIQQCRACGYCAPDFASVDGVGNPDVKTLGYRALLMKDDAFPAARKFRCYAYLAKQAADYKIACWALLNAAWVCDDRGGRRGDRSGRHFREDVLAALNELHARGEHLLPYDSFDSLLRLDLWRRTCQFATVIDADLTASRRHYRFFWRVAAFQRELACKGDARSYSIEQALRARTRAG